MKENKYVVNATLIAILLLYVVPVLGRSQKELDLQTSLEKYVAQTNAQIGIAVISDNKQITINNESHYPLNSVMKLFQAVAVLNKMAAEQIPLQTNFEIDVSQLKADTYSPLRDSLAPDTKSFTISIENLLLLSLQQSDNNACDILFSSVISIAEMNSYLDSLEVGDFQILWNEDDMHKRQERTEDNWSTPLTAANLITQIFEKSLFAKTYQVFLQDAIVNCKTGENRLPAPTKNTNSIVAHKTGTGFPSPNGNPQGINDVGFFQLPNGKKYAIAVFIKTSSENMVTTEKIIADISEIVYSYFVL